MLNQAAKQPSGVLDEINKALSDLPASRREALEKVVRIVTNQTGDGCMITLLDVARKNLMNIASAHRDRKLEDFYKSYMLGTPVPVATSQSISAQVVRSGLAQVRQVEPREMAASTDEDLKPLVEQLNVYSFVVVPIKAPSGIIGTLSFLINTPFKTYTQDDLHLAENIAKRLGLALEM